MLAEECPNERCFGVPLVRPPKPGGEKDPRKVRRSMSPNTSRLILGQECVICKTVYVTEVDWAGRERLVPENSVEDVVPPATGSKGKTREIEVEVGSI